MTPRLLAIVCGGLVLLRAALPAHAPALVDAHAALVACALVAVVPVPAQGLRIAALVLLAVIAPMPWSWDPWWSLLSLPIVLGSAAFFCLGGGATAPLRAGILVGVATAGGLNAMISVYQRAVLYPRTLAEAARLSLSESEIGRLASARPLGMSLSPDLAAALSLAGLFAAGALAVAPPHPRARTPAAVGAVLCLIGVLVSRSAGTALALAAGLVAAAVLLGERKRALLGLAGAALPIGAVLAARGLDPLLTSAHERLLNYKAALTVLAESPLVGVGYARFAPAYAAFREPGSNVTRYAHGAWAQMLAETGVVGGLLGALALALFVACARTAMKDAESVRWRAVVLGGVVALTVRAAIDYDLQIGQTAMLSAVFAGLALSEVELGAPGLRVQRIAAITAVVFALALVGVLGTREAALRADPPAPLAVRSYAERIPFDVEGQLARARLDIDALATCADAACEAIEANARAGLDALVGRRHPPSAAWLLRAQLRMRTGDLSGALADADAALRIDPGNELAHRMGVALAEQLDEPDAGITAREDAASRWGVVLAAP